MKRLWIFLIFSFMLIACQKEDILHPPKNIRYDDEMILWDVDEKATAYHIILNDVLYPLTEPFFDMHHLPNGLYHVVICTIKDHESSLYSEPFSFTVNRPFDIPQNINIQDGIVSWQEVDDALGYILLVNDITYPVQRTTFDLSFLEENKTYLLSVKACFELGDSPYTVAIIYLPYYDVIKTYEGTYNINIPMDLSIYIDQVFDIDHIYYNQIFLNRDDFVIHEHHLSISHLLLSDLDLGHHVFQIYTSEGVIDLPIEIIELTQPVIISNPIANYVMQKDMTWLFEMFNGSFLGVTGHNIEASDYQFEDGVLTLYASFLDLKIETFDGDTIIFSYQLKDGDHIIIGYLFILIS